VRSPVRLRKPDGTEDPFAPEPPPELGAHTDDALAAAGFTSDEIAALHAAGAV
jgi:crotonobetainyl-CoA:carnitine CoA-transferase CaiB-like acyl-CoA transferase